MAKGAPARAALTNNENPPSPPFDKGGLGRFKSHFLCKLGTIHTSEFSSYLAKMMPSFYFSLPDDPIREAAGPFGNKAEGS